jgi:hypothetical protein
MAKKLTPYQVALLINTYKNCKDIKETAKTVELPIGVCITRLKIEGLITDEEATSMKSGNKSKVKTAKTVKNKDTKPKAKKTNVRKKTVVKPDDSKDRMITREEKIAYLDAKYGKGNYKILTKEEFIQRAIMLYEIEKG